MTRSNVEVISPFKGDPHLSEKTVLDELGIKDISKQPVSQVFVEYQSRKTSDVTVIMAEESSYFGLAFFAYCDKYYGKKGVLEISLSLKKEMIVESVYYYGKNLWKDHSVSHPYLEPFRRAAAGEFVTVRIFYD